MERNRLFDSLLLTVLLIGLSAFPTDLITNDPYIYYAIEIGLQGLCLIFIYLYAYRHKGVFPELSRPNIKNLLLLSPLLLVTCSNFFYAWICNEKYSPIFAWYHLLQAIFIVLVVINEELIFRHMLLGNLLHPNKVIRILISAGIFALCHLTHFFASFNPIALIDVVYTFALGIVLGFIYIYGRSLVACIIFHFIFNAINGFLYPQMYPFITSNLYYLINALVAVLGGIYLLLIYLFVFNKKSSNNWMN